MQYRFDQIAFNSTAKKKPTDDDKEHYIGLEHLDSDCLSITRWGSDVAPTGEKLLMKKGDILFGKRRAYQRKVGIAPFDGIFSAHGMVLRPNEEVINKDFFPFFISSDQFMERAVRISVGGLSPTINWKDLREQEFELPSLDKQLVLADKLWAAYRLKESYKKLLVATDEMVKSQFIEMFGTLDEPKVEIKKLIDVVLGSGQYGSNTSATDYQESMPRYIRITDINDDGSLNDDIKTAEVIDDKFRLVSGDIVFARTGATVGKTYLHEAGDAIYAGYLIKYQMDTNLMKPSFMKAFTHSKTYYDWVANSQKVGAQPNISATQYDQMPILVPSVCDQEAFLKIYQQADKSKFELRKSIEAIDRVIKSLINNV